MSSRRDDYHIFEDEEMRVDEERVLVYMKQAEYMKNTDKRTMTVDMRHVMEYDVNYEIREPIMTEFYR